MVLTIKHLPQIYVLRLDIHVLALKIKYYKKYIKLKIKALEKDL